MYVIMELTGDHINRLRGSGSVVIPVFNGEVYHREVIDSVLWNCITISILITGGANTRKSL